MNAPSPYPPRPGFTFVAALPDGDWRLHPALGGQCVLAFDTSHQNMPRLVIDGRTIALIGVDIGQYAEFLLDDSSKGRKH